MEPFSQFEMLTIKSYRQHISDMVRKMKHGKSYDLNQVSACVMPSGTMVCKIRKNRDFFMLTFADGEQFVDSDTLQQIIDTMVPSYIVKKHFPELLL